jgi:polysaccharide biosynthesis transport protein
MENENESQVVNFSYQEFLAILRRRRNLVIQVFFAVFGVGVIVTLITKPTYEAISELLVDPPSQNLGTISSASDPLQSVFSPASEQDVLTQVEVLQATPLINQVEQTCGRAELTVAEVKQTNVISVTSDAGSPQLAANAANTLLDDYLQQMSDRDLADIRTARDFVARQETLTGLELEDAEEKLRQYRATHHIDVIDENRSSLLDKVAGLETNYQTAESNLTGLTSQLATAKSLYASRAANDVNPIMVTNPQIAQLQTEIGSLEITRTTDLQPGGYTPSSTVIRSLDAQIKALQNSLHTTPQLVPSFESSDDTSRGALRAQIDNLMAQIPADQAEANQYSSELAAAQGQLSDYPSMETEMDHLTRERDDALRDDETFSQNLNNLTLRLQAEHVGAHIIERAEIPTAPIRPNKLLNVIISVLAGLLVGSSVALIQEYIDDRINSTEDAERVLELPSLGRVPQLSANDARLLPQMKGLDPETEAYRILRTNIHFASVDKPLKTMQVTSASLGEGKTTTAANLAFAMAMDGKKVIIVDTDLRRPSLHKLLGIGQVPGVTDLLLGTATLQDTIRPYENLPGMFVIPAGITPPNPSELLNSQKFLSLMEQLKDVCDLVIFDSPPILAAADSQIISAKVDGVILVVANSETRKASARQSVKILRQARANILGVAYNKTNAQESYYYYHYHYVTPDLGKDETDDTTNQLVERVESDHAVTPK